MTEITRACVECGDRPANKGHRKCGPCRYKELPTSECEGCGREMPIVARGRCGACLSRDSRARRGYTRAVHSRVCEFCSAAYVTKDSRSRFCSLECASRDQHGWSRSKEVARRSLTRVWHGHASVGGVFTSGPCVECGSLFVAQGVAKYCSESCSNRASWRRRYERRGEFVVSPKVRLEIYERDAWTCQLCFEQVDPALPYTDSWSATLDHVVPQSHQLVPDHSPKNLRLAHRLCNSLRGDGLREVDYGSRVEALRNVGCVPASSS